jgi:hypothetical protein
MSRFTPFAFGLALPLTLVSHAAFADLTPAQVWGDWRQYMEGFGYQVQATETVNGRDLVVSDMRMSFAIPEGDGQMTMTLGAVSFNQNSDGSVAVILPDVMPITIAGTGTAPGEDLNITMQLTQAGHTMTASGSPEKIVYDYAAQTMQMNVDQQMTHAQNGGKDSAQMSFTGQNITSKTTMTIGAMRGYEQASNIASIAYDVAIASSQDGGQTANITGTANGLSIEGAGTMPQGLPLNGDMVAMLEAGFDVAGKIAYANGSSELTAQNPRNGDFTAQTSSQGGTLDVAIGAGGLAYGGAQQDLKMTVNVAAMPFPIEMAMAESGFNLMLPVKKADQPQDFAFGITLGNFTMSDLLWSIFDQAGQLPRNPATIKLDLSGKAKVLVDYMVPDNVANIDGPQASLEALDLNTLLIEAVGARFEGSGAITVDSTRPGMVPGIGAPVGAINFALTGGNGLLDKLTAMGLLPQEQAMGARMMMGIFAVPGDAPDTLNSKIEFTQDGQVLANGQRIR